MKRSNQAPEAQAVEQAERSAVVDAAVRGFAAVLEKALRSGKLEKPEGADIDKAVKWAHRHLARAVDELLAVGGEPQSVMMAAQSLPSYVAATISARAKAGERDEQERGKRTTPGNGVPRREDEG